jgi:NitT/TauT family transport system permease protein
MKQNIIKKTLSKFGNKIVSSGIATWILFVVIWYIVSLFQDDLFFPSPVATLKGTWEIIENGKLFLFALISLRRVFIGWSIGTLIAIPLGLLIGRIQILRKLIEPFINFFRFVPGLALLTLFLMWFGVGELSKVVLIVYGTVFTVVVNTIAGVIAVDQDRINSARTLGVSEWKIIYSVIWPSVIPYVFTGARLGLGGAFSSIIAAEMLAAKEGIGYLIYTSRMYFHTDWIFAGIIVLGLMGYISDKLLRMLGNKLLKKYGVYEKAGF